MVNYSALEYAKAGADTIIAKYDAADLPPERFHYHQGVFLTGISKLYHLTDEEKYYNYLKSWVDSHIDEDGNCLKCRLDQFDDMQPGMLLFELYNKTGDYRYKKVLDMIIEAVESHPKNALGGVWHKRHLKNQMWLDSMYMMGMIVTEYALEFDEPYLLEVVYQQMKLMYDKMRNPKTGLLYHAWDDSKEARWADKETGCSPEHWGRAMGWYAVAVTEIAGLLPKNNPHKTEFSAVAGDIIKAIFRYQDGETGLWYQILDKGEHKDNWHETSCSALFTYAAAKAWGMGIIDDSYKDKIIKGYEGVLSKVEMVDGILGIEGVCIGTGVGPERFYFERPTVSTDLHGMGAFLYMCCEMNEKFEM